MDQLSQVLHRYWGYDHFRPLQREAMTAVLEGRDSVVVMPTGGGKSLCFQAPAACLPGLAVVVSPLISLMKDQVDTLTECGLPAAYINSTLTPAERRSVTDRVQQGKLKLLYIAPERLCTAGSIEFLKQQQVSFFAVDEAHCISSWGHDFRPEYRMLGKLKDEFPGLAIHAYTATATENVRMDIANQLSLQEPQYHVGSFDRPNLSYRVQSRTDMLKQVRAVLDRHSGEAGIVYCIRRADCDDLSRALNEAGYRSLPYHAGLSDVERQRHQDAFLQDEIDTIVATVAFGMGIDKPNVRYVIHAGAPKSLEAYQQESGRAGRDGLEAECVILPAAQDFLMWRRMQSELEGDGADAAENTLRAMQAFCQNVTCRHKQLVEYFGQPFESENCQACDVCLAEVELLPEALIIAQKILSCVVRLQQRYGADYTASVLLGSREQRIRENGHDKLTTYALLKQFDKKDIRGWIEQLVGQGFLNRDGEYQTLILTHSGREVLKGEVTPRLSQASQKPAQRRSRGEVDSWAGVHRGLFEALRTLRREVAETRGVPSFMVFSDAAIRDMARRRPTSLDAFRLINGVGEKKLADYGSQFTLVIHDYCQSQTLPTDLEIEAEPEANPAPSETPPIPVKPKTAEQKQQQLARVSPAMQRAFELFRDGKAVSDVAAEIDRALSTTYGYLQSFLESERITQPEPWIAAPLWERIRESIERLGSDKLKPLYEDLQGDVSYDDLRIALICLKCSADEVASST